MADSLPELLPGLVEAVKAVAQLELPDPSDIFVSSCFNRSEHDSEHCFGDFTEAAGSQEFAPASRMTVLLAYKQPSHETVHH
jgi:hypothetical protein